MSKIGVMSKMGKAGRRPERPLMKGIPHFIDLRSIQKTKGDLIITPLEGIPGELVDPKKAVINRRGRVVPKATKRLLDEADRHTAVVDGIEALPGNLWDELGHIFPRDEGQSIRSHIRTTRKVRLHAQLVRPRFLGGEVLHHIHLSRAGSKPESHLDRFVLGGEKRMFGRKYTKAHPLDIQPDGTLRVRTDRYVLIRGSRRDLKRWLVSNRPKKGGGPLQIFRKVASRILGIKD